MKVSVIGLGAMGKAIASNLVKAGHEVVVWNRSAEPVRELAAQGALAAASPAQAMQSPVVLSSLADDAAFEAVFSPEVLAARSGPVVHVNMATVSTTAARRFATAHADAGCEYVGAPVFGRAEVAAAGKLNVVAGGREATIQALYPIFSAIAQKVWYVGPDPVHAHAVKIAGNFMIACVIETLGEAMALVEKQGLAPSVFTEIMTSTLFAAPVYKIYSDLINQRRYEPAAFKLSLGLKDVGLALQAGKESHVPLPLASLIQDHFIEAMAQGRGDQDWAALADLLRGKAGLAQTGSS